MTAFFAEVMSIGLQLLARALTAVRGLWVGVDPADVQRIYYANHTSNGDFIMVWTALPKPIRDKTRPVAASDYWFKSKLRKFVGEHVVKAVLIDRNPETRNADPVELMTDALNEGSSLIIFPEGKRNQSEDDKLLRFKTGLYHVLKANPHVEAVPAWIENLNRILPKGTLLPIPLICTVTYGAPLKIKENETKGQFLGRAHKALIATSELRERNGDDI
ncbi:MAG: lysophospholipid acyltransferase family protein [Planktomarina sp.]